MWSIIFRNTNSLMERLDSYRKAKYIKIDSAQTALIKIRSKNKICKILVYMTIPQRGSYFSINPCSFSTIRI